MWPIFFAFKELGIEIEIEFYIYDLIINCNSSEENTVFMELHMATCVCYILSNAV